MKKRYYSKAWLFFLVTAVLSLQWSATHIHLAAQHAHGGDYHQHAPAVHQHATTGHHADAIDVAVDALSHVDGHKVVELDHDCAQLHLKKTFQLAAIPSASWRLFETTTLTETIPFPRKLDNYQTYPQYSTTRLRAPPVFS